MPNDREVPVLNISKQYMNNTKAGKILAIRNKPVREEQVGFSVMIHNDVKICLNIWKDPNIVLSSDNITRFDMIVLDAVYSIMCAGVDVITPEMIARVMSGNPKQEISSKKAQQIVESIDKLRYIHIRIDFRDEMSDRFNRGR